MNRLLKLARDYLKFMSSSICGAGFSGGGVIERKKGNDMKMFHVEHNTKKERNMTKLLPIQCIQGAFHTRIEDDFDKKYIIRHELVFLGLDPANGIDPTKIFVLYYQGIFMGSFSTKEKAIEASKFMDQENIIYRGGQNGK